MRLLEFWAPNLVLVASALSVAPQISYWLRINPHWSRTELFLVYSLSAIQAIPTQMILHCLHTPWLKL